VQRDSSQFVPGQRERTRPPGAACGWKATLQEAIAAILELDLGDEVTSSSQLAVVEIYSYKIESNEVRTYGRRIRRRTVGFGSKHLRIKAKYPLNTLFKRAQGALQILSASGKGPGKCRVPGLGRIRHTSQSFLLSNVGIKDFDHAPYVGD
jgi:hypothetical protein